MPWAASFDQLTHDFSALPFRYQELTQLVKLTPLIAGSRCRLHLTNRYGSHSLRFEEVAIANRTAHGPQGIFTYHGESTIVIPAGGELNTDPLDFPIYVGQAVYVTMRAHHRQTYADFASCYHPGWVNAMLARSSQAQPELSHNWHQRKGWFSLERLDVLSDHQPLDVEITGDSLVETGMLTTPLFHYSCQHFPNQIAWHATGILGNQLLHDGPSDEPLYQTFGPALLKRQVLQTPRPLTIALIGSNDLVVPFYSHQENMASVGQLTTGYQHLADHCARLIVPSLTPVAPAGLTHDSIHLINQRRQALNHWLVQQPWCVDINRRMANLDDTALKGPLNFGDGLHWSPRGGRVAAQLLLPQIVAQLHHLLH